MKRCPFVSITVSFLVLLLAGQIPANAAVPGTVTIHFDDRPLGALDGSAFPGVTFSTEPFPATDIGDNVAPIHSAPHALTAYPFTSSASGGYPDEPTLVVVAADGNFPPEVKDSFPGVIQMDFDHPVVDFSMWIGQSAVTCPVIVDIYDTGGSVHRTTTNTSSYQFHATPVDYLIDRVRVYPDPDNACGCYTVDDISFTSIRPDLVSVVSYWQEEALSCGDQAYLMVELTNDNLSLIHI